jgi:hypothetical protein
MFDIASTIFYVNSSYPIGLLKQFKVGYFSNKIFSPPLYFPPNFSKYLSTKSLEIYFSFINSMESVIMKYPWNFLKHQIKN